MNIPKDGPGGNASGPQTQDKAAQADQTGSLPPAVQESVKPPAELHVSGSMPAPLSVAVAPPVNPSAPQPLSPSPDEEEPVNPLARLAEIVALSPTAPIVPEGQAPLAAPPVMPPLAAAPAPQSVPLPHQPMAPSLPPPVAVPQMIELAAEDRLAAPVPQPVKKRFSLFRRKAEESAAPTVAELTEETQKKRGFFGRRAVRHADANAERAKRTGRDKRYARRRRRVWFEELLGWIFVPVILVALYYAVMGILVVLGTTPEAIIAGIKTVLGHF